MTPTLSLALTFTGTMLVTLELPNGAAMDTAGACVSALLVVPMAASIVPEAEGVSRIMLADGAPPAALLSALVRAGAEIERFEPMLAPMEDIFLRVVGGRA